MKRYFIYVFILFALCLCGVTANAQADKPYYTDDSHILFVPKRTVLFPLSDYSVEKVQKERFSDSWSSDYVNTYLLNKKVRVSSDSDIPVIGYTKSGIGVKEYDYYIVEYNNQLCYLPKQSCPDNSLIDSKNAEIQSYYKSMQQELIDLSEEFLYRVTMKAQKAANELAILKERKSFLIDSTSTAQIQQKEAEMKKEYEAWKENLSDAGLKASKIIVIHNAELSSPNSAAGCDYSLRYTNNSSKTIKYLDWKGNAYNAVNDIVSCDIRNTSLLQGRETGPVMAHEEGGGLWETIIYNWSAKELRLTNITITYTDGTKAILNGKEIRAITGAPFIQLSLGQKALIKSDAQFEIEKKIRELEEVSKYLHTPENARSLVPDALKEEEALFKRIQELGHESFDYRFRNSIPSWDDAPESLKRLTMVY